MKPPYVGPEIVTKGGDAERVRRRLAGPSQTGTGMLLTIVDLDRIEGEWMDFCDLHAHEHLQPTKLAAWILCTEEPCASHKAVLATARAALFAISVATKPRRWFWPSW